MNDRRQDIFIRAVIADLPQGKGITIFKKLLQFSGQRFTRNISTLCKKFVTARNNEPLEGKRFFCFLVGRPKVLHHVVPSLSKPAVRFFEIIVERRALTVDVLIAVMFCRAFRLRSDHGKVSLFEFLNA